MVTWNQRSDLRAMHAGFNFQLASELFHSFFHSDDPNADSFA